MTFDSKAETFRQAEARFNRTEQFQPLYWPKYGDDQRLHCSYCRGPVEDKHPKGARDVCPVYQRFLADQ